MYIFTTPASFHLYLFLTLFDFQNFPKFLIKKTKSNVICVLFFFRQKLAETNKLEKNLKNQ